MYVVAGILVSALVIFIICSPVIVVYLIYLKRKEIIERKNGTGYLAKLTEHRDRFKNFEQKKYPSGQTVTEAMREILEKDVSYFAWLNKESQERFLKRVIWFIKHYPIYGIGYTLNIRHYTLAAAGAMIPCMSLKQTPYRYLGAVWIYPDVFYFGSEDGESLTARGLVRKHRNAFVVMLSAKHLIEGFTINDDGKNVAVHEFSHLIDAADGQVDGLPLIMAPDDIIDIWDDLMVRSLALGSSGHTIRKYGYSNEREFFAVVSELYFENPLKMKIDTPELYKATAAIYGEDLAETIMKKPGLLPAAKRLLRRANPLNLQSVKCPCESGKLYAKCCAPKIAFAESPANLQY